MTYEEVKRIEARRYRERVRIEEQAAKAAKAAKRQRMINMIVDVSMAAVVVAITALVIWVAAALLADQRERRKEVARMIEARQAARAHEVAEVWR